MSSPPHFTYSSEVSGFQTVFRGRHSCLPQTHLLHNEAGKHNFSNYCIFLVFLPISAYNRLCFISSANHCFSTNARILKKCFTNFLLFQEPTMYTSTLHVFTTKPKCYGLNSISDNNDITVSFLEY